MHLLTAKEIEQLRSAGVKVVLDDISGYERRKISYYPQDGKMLVACRGYIEMLAEFSDRVVARTHTVEYLSIIDGKIIGWFTARVGSFDHYGDRRFADHIRKRALRRAKRVLAV